MLAEVFKAVIIMSLMGGGAVLVLLALKPLTERLFDAKSRFFVWLAVLIVFILPMRFENKLSLPEPVSRSLNVGTVNKAPTVSVVEDYSGVYMTEREPEPQKEFCDWAELLAVFWVTVAGCLFVGTVSSNIRLKHRLYNNSTHCAKHGKISIRETALVGAPLLVGWLKPVLYVPDGVFESSGMTYILAHEEIHLKRNDICIKWIVALVKCVHWFNPLSYVVARRIDEAGEISCDTEATKSMDKEQRHMYMQVIMDVSYNEVNFRKSLVVGLSAEGKCLKRRFEAIKRTPKRSRLAAIFGGFIVGMVIVFFGCVGGIVRGSETKPEDAAQLVLIKAKNEPQPEKEGIEEQQERQPESDVQKPAEKAKTIETEKTVVPETEPSELLEEDISEPQALPKAAIRGEFNSDGGDSRLIKGVSADGDGCINVEIHSNAQEAVDIFISDPESGKGVYSFTMPVPYENAYCIEGLEPNKTYDIVLKGTMRKDWNIESEYIIF